MEKRSGFHIHWHDEYNVDHAIDVPAGWAEQEVSLLVDQINSGAFNVKSEEEIDLAAPAKYDDNPC